jgi:hypothetical protein
MVGALAYVGVFTAQCYAHEPGDCEPAPLGAAFAPSATATTSISVGAGAFYCAANMTGDEQIKVVQPKPGQNFSARATGQCGKSTVVVALRG